MPPRLNTCAPWATLDDLPEDCIDEDADYGEKVLQMATDVLFEFTGRRWPGVCSDLVRPYSCGCAGVSSCSCSSLRQIQLPRRPVVDVLNVWIDGVVIDPEWYRIDGDRNLVFLDEEAEADGSSLRGFPSAQRLKRELTEPDTFGVEYTFGTPPPDGADIVAATLGCELMKAFSPNSETAKGCRLPRRVTSVTRQGVTIAVLDPLTLFSDERTGIPEVDLWVAAKNRTRHNRSGSVHIPRPPGNDWRFRRNG